MARVLASLLLASLLSGGAAQNTTFESGISLVHIDAEVLGPDNRILTGFSKQDFRILDDGREQPVLNILREEQPLDLILLFDISASMRGVVREVASTADTGLQQLRSGDRVSVMVFNTHSSVLAPFTADLVEVADTIRLNVTHQHFGGGTAIQTAVDDAALQFLDESQSERRRAVLIITDNIGLRTRHESSVVHDFWRAGALLSGLIVADPAYKTAHKINNIIAPQTLLVEAGMKGIAEKTGGDTIESDSPATAFAQMLHRIRTRYSLYYRMPQSRSGQTRTIKVELGPDARKQFPDARVRARHGYIVP